MLVHERVEVDRHEIVHHRSVAVHPVRAHDGRVFVMCVEPEVEIFRVVGDVDFGRLGRGRTVEWRRLHEFGEHCCGLPHFVVEAAVDFRRCVGTGWTHRRTVGNQTGVIHDRIYNGGGLAPALGLACHLAGYEKQGLPQDQSHSQSQTEPLLPGVRPGSVMYGHTEAQHVLVSNRNKVE